MRGEALGQSREQSGLSAKHEPLPWLLLPSLPSPTGQGRKWRFYFFMAKLPLPTLKREAGFVFLAHLQVGGEMRWMFWLEVQGLPQEGVLPREAYTPALLCPPPSRQEALPLPDSCSPLGGHTCKRVSVLDPTADCGVAGRSDIAHSRPLGTEGQSLKPSCQDGPTLWGPQPSPHLVPWLRPTLRDWPGSHARVVRARTGHPSFRCPRDGGPSRLLAGPASPGGG